MTLWERLAAHRVNRHVKQNATEGAIELVEKARAMSALKSVYDGCRMAVGIVSFFQAVILYSQRINIGYLVGYEHGVDVGMKASQADVYRRGYDAGYTHEAYRSTGAY